MRVEIKEVNQRQEARLFSRFGNALYADNPYYVPDMENDIMNKIARNNDSEGETIPFLAFRGDQVVGRILGIINHKANRKWNTKVVRFASSHCRCRAMGQSSWDGNDPRANGPYRL